MAVKNTDQLRLNHYLILRKLVQRQDRTRYRKDCPQSQIHSTWTCWKDAAIWVRRKTPEMLHVLGTSMASALTQMAAGFQQLRQGDVESICRAQPFHFGSRQEQLGMVCRLTENDRFELTELLRSIVDRDTDALTHSLIRLCQRRGPAVQQKAMERDVLAMLDATNAVPINEIKIGQLLMDIMTLIRNHQLQLPTDYVIMIKALLTAEGSARQAYPDLDVVSEIKDRVLRFAKEHYRPEIIWCNLRNTFSNLWGPQRELPRQIQQIIRKLEKGESGFNLHLNRSCTLKSMSGTPI